METLYTALNHPTSLAVVCILLGGIGRDIINRLLSKGDTYRTEIDSLRDEVHALTVEVTRWRNEYYALLDAVIRGDRSAVTDMLKEKP